MRWIYEIKENLVVVNFNDLIDGLFYLLGIYIDLLRELVVEFILIDNFVNIIIFLLRIMCYVDDSVILGFWF